MSANPQRRRLLGLLAATPLAAAAGVQSAPAFARLRAMAGPGWLDDLAPSAIARVAEGASGASLPGIGAAIERAHPLDPDLPPYLADLVASLGTDPTGVLMQQAAEARAIAAAALVYPPEIAAYRSFGAPMRRRLYAELLMRESERLAALSEPPPTPPASPGPDA